MARSPSRTLNSVEDAGPRRWFGELGNAAAPVANVVVMCMVVVDATSVSEREPPSRGAGQGVVRHASRTTGAGRGQGAAAARRGFFAKR